MSTVPDLSKPLAASLKPVLFFHVEADEPQLIFQNSTGFLNHVPITGGFVKSLDPKYPFDAVIDSGLDDISFSSANPAVGHLDCNFYLSFKDDFKKRAYIHYTGVVQFEGLVADVVANKASKMEFTDGYVTCHPIFKLDDNCKDEQWVNKLNFIGKGRFIRDEDGKLKVQYYVYTFA